MGSRAANRASGAYNHTNVILPFFDRLSHLGEIFIKIVDKFHVALSGDVVDQSLSNVGSNAEHGKTTAKCAPNVMKGKVPKVCAEDFSQLFHCFRPPIKWLVWFASRREKEDIAARSIDDVDLAKDFLCKGW